MMRTLGRWAAGLVLSVAVAAPLAAQEQTPAANRQSPVSIVAVNLTAREAAQAGRPRPAEDAAKVFTGDVMEYQLSFVNNTGGAVKNVVLEDPLPRGLVYVDGSATPTSPALVVEYSIDGGRSYSARPMVRTLVNGQEVVQPAPASQITHIRWRATGSVNPGARVSASFRARLGAVTP